jgi:diacylglycerol kinase (ATP)
MSHAKVIVNPVAGGGSIRRHWPRVCCELNDAGLSFDYEFTKSPGHAIEIAKRAIRDQYQYLIAVGGDGTVNEVANGILTSAHPDDTTLGIISAGTACGFSRSLGSNKRILVDVCEVEYQNHGKHLHRFFLNEASIGLGAAIVDAWKLLPNCFGHSVNLKLRATTSYSALLTHRNRMVKLRVDDKDEDIRACYLVVANGQYFADGMQIAPHARPNDGLMNLVTIGDVTKSELLKIVPTVYGGRHIGHPKITERSARTIGVECDNQLLVEADGEILGQCPSTFKIMPLALSVMVVGPDRSVS